MTPLADTLLKHIADSGENLHMLAKNSNVDYGALYRFVHQGRQLQLHVVQRLCDYFRLELRPAETPPSKIDRPKPKAGRKKPDSPNREPRS